jgi:prepilin signal peptidase PulO-like enzyme (type II secretory pathway)
VPVLSWALHRGRCRHSKHPIGIRYPLTEVACATGAAFLVAQFHVTWEMIALCGLWWCIVAIFVTDLEHYIILDEVQIAAALFGLLYGWATGVAWDDMLGAAFTGIAIGLTLKYGFIYFRNKDGLGMGDVKFLGVAGIWLAQWMDFVPFLFFSGVLGIVSGIGWTLLGRGERFPFGPALAVALFICVVFPHIADNFWNLYGAIQN